MGSQHDMYYQLISALPKGVRDDVRKVYSFFKYAYDSAELAFVDDEQLTKLISTWKKAKRNSATSSMKEEDSGAVTESRHMAYIVHRYGCDAHQVDMFLKTISLHDNSKAFTSPVEQTQYMEKTTGVIGYFVAKVIGVKDSHMSHAYSLALALRQAAFVRNMGEDVLNNRQYFPKESLIMHGLKKLSEEEVVKKQAEFREFIEEQAKTYKDYRDDGALLRRYIPIRTRPVHATALAMHDWIMKQIVDNPLIVFEKKVTPGKLLFNYTRAVKKFSV